ncbi:MAG: ABC transporter substrate-binding protein [Arcobacteraceae bacterium]|nr:ABC transporter substrate-binding protein [Arcobacteraceae bacterium]
MTTITTILKFTIFSLLFQSILFADRGDFEKVTLQLQWLHQFQFAGYYIAKEKDFYKQVGLKVDIKEFKQGINPVNIVTSNKATYGVGRSSLIIDKSNGANIKLLSAIFQSSPSVLVATKKSNIKTIKDFTGKRIMTTPNISQTVSIQAMAKQKGVNINNMIIQKHSFDINDLIKGKTDLMASYISNEPFMLKQKGIKYTVFDPKDYGFDFYSDILFTSDDEVIKHKQRALKFKAATLKGWQYAFNNIDETVNIILEKYNTQNKSKEALIYEANELKKLAFYNTKKLGTIDINKIQRIYDIYNVIGLVKNKVNMDEFIFKAKKDNLSLTFDETQYIQNNKIIRMCNNHKVAPLEFAVNGNQNDMQGISIDTLKLIEEQLDIKFVNVNTKNWEESQQFLKEKKCDILPLTAKTPEREEYANFTKSYLNLPLAIFTHKNSATVVDFEDIIDKSMARRNGSGLITKLKNKYPNINIIQTANALESLQYVNNEKAYFSIGMIPIVSNLMSKYLLENIHIAGYTDIIYHLSIAVRDDDILLLNILNKSLDNITKKQHKQIYRKWVNPIVKEKITDYTLLLQILFIVIIVLLALAYKHFTLKSLNIQLEKQVEEKTKDLKDINKNLKVIIKNKTQELQKNIDMISKYVIFSKTDLKGIITEASDAFSDISQYSKKELIGKPHNIIRHPDMPASAFKDMWSTIQSDEVWKGEVKNLKKDGTYYWIEANISPEYDKNGNIQGYLAVRHDITAKKDFEKQHIQLIQSAKMASMGEMIGNIAHQWRQPLSVISMGASGMQIQKEQDILTDKMFNETCKMIDENTQYLSKTIDDFTNFIKDDRVRKIFELEAVIKSFLNLIEGSVKSNNIDIIINLQKNIKIDGYENELTQCFINIFKNAKDIFKERKIKNKLIFLSTKIEDNKAIIEIRDNAGGISDDILSKIFEPYFTTKHQSQGTGLGLHMSKDIIEKHLKGRLYAKNTNDGAIFYIELPL